MITYIVSIFKIIYKFTCWLRDNTFVIAHSLPPCDKKGLQILWAGPLQETSADADNKHSSFENGY